MAYCGHILCRKCRQSLYLGKHKEGRFWLNNVDESQIATGVLMFLQKHFAHGDVTLMGDGPYEQHLDQCSQSEWPTTLFVEVRDDGQVCLVPQNFNRGI